MQSEVKAELDTFFFDQSDFRRQFVNPTLTLLSRSSKDKSDPGGKWTFQILSDDTQRIVHRSAVCSALNKSERNCQLDPFEGENS